MQFYLSIITLKKGMKIELCINVSKRERVYVLKFSKVCCSPRPHPTHGGAVKGEGGDHPTQIIFLLLNKRGVVKMSFQSIIQLSFYFQTLEKNFRSLLSPPWEEEGGNHPTQKFFLTVKQERSSQNAVSKQHLA